MAFKPSLALFLFVMRKIFLIILWLLLQMPLCMQAQEPQRFFERHYIDDLIFMNENDLLVLGADESMTVRSGYSLRSTRMTLSGCKE